VIPARVQDHVRAGGGEAASHRGAKPARGAGDEGGAAVEAEAIETYGAL
jgi:hypothetical protein